MRKLTMAQRPCLMQLILKKASQDEGCSLPLHITYRTGAHVEVVRLLTSQDAATLHYTDNTGSLPIHAASGAGYSLETIQHLVEVGGGAVTLSA